MLAAAVAAFVTIFLAEFGDKTQLVSMCMAARYSPLQVLAGAMAALAMVIGFAVAVGGLLAAYIPHTLVTVLSGIIFIIIGIYNYLKKEEETQECDNRNGFIQTMLLVFVAEFGDKTQVAAMLLTASLGYPAAVFGGAMLAMLCNHLIAVFLGSRVMAKLKPSLLKLGTAALFIVIGLLIVIIEILPLQG